MGKRTNNKPKKKKKRRTGRAALFGTMGAETACGWMEKERERKGNRRTHVRYTELHTRNAFASVPVAFLQWDLAG